MQCHTVHMLTQRLLLPPLTSTVKLSLFTHAHPSLLSLAARLQWCIANHSCYINNGWTFSDRLHRTQHLTLVKYSFSIIHKYYIYKIIDHTVGNRLNLTKSKIVVCYRSYPIKQTHLRKQWQNSNNKVIEITSVWKLECIILNNLCAI